MAVLNVLLNGQQVVVGALTTKNIWSAAAASGLAGEFDNYDHQTPDQIWELFGEAAASSPYGSLDSCATRVSIALNRQGYRLSSSPHSNNISLFEGWSTEVLNPLDEETGLPIHPDQGQHVIFSATGMFEFLSGDVVGVPLDFTNGGYVPEAGDVIIAGYTNPNGTGHIEMGTVPVPEPNQPLEVFAQKVWILHRPTWELDVEGEE